LNLTIVVPTCNEGAALAELLEALEGFALMSPFAVQVIVVDDGSVDGAGRVLHEASHSRPWLTVISERETSGVGASLRAGVAQAAHPLAAWVTPRGCRLKDLWEMRRALLDGADLAIGSRAAPGGRYGRRLSLASLGGRVFSALAGWALDAPSSDCTNLFCAFRVSAYQELRLLRDDEAIAAELLFKADAHGLRVDEIPTVATPRPRPLIELWRKGVACVAVAVEAFLARLSGGRQ
jgi:dolichol-phosphate mannosyltransferase